MTRSQTTNFFLLACLVLALGVILWHSGKTFRAAGGSDSRDAEPRPGALPGAGSAAAAGALPSKSGTRDPWKKSKLVTTASGLQYEVLVEGTGRRPGPTDKVKVHYHGTTPEGEVFDSSIDRGAPASLPLNAVIKGWSEGLQLMRTGAKYKFIIPSELAYGERGAGKIGPNQTLLFEIELLAIE